MFEFFGGTPPIEKPSLTPVSDAVAHLLSLHVEQLNDRTQRVDIDLENMLEEGPALRSAMHDFMQLIGVPTELEETFEEGYTLAYNLLASQAGFNDVDLPKVTEESVDLYFKQVPYSYGDVDSFYTLKTEYLEIDDVFGHDALQDYLDFYTDELSGNHRYAIVFGFAALYDIVEYHSSLEVTTDASTRQN